MSTTLKVGFVVLIITTLSALFIRKPYELLADFSLRQVGTLQTIQDIDDRLLLNNISEATEDFWDNLEAFFTGSDTSDESDTDKTGFFEETLYPGLVSALTFIYRVLTIILSLLGLLVIVYLSYTTSGATDVAQLKQEMKRLKQRIEKLEKKEG